MDIFSIQVEITEDLFDKVGLRQMVGVVINSINVDPQKILDVSFFGHVQPRALDVGDDLFKFIFVRPGKNGIIST